MDINYVEKDFKDCEIFEVAQKIPTIYNEIWLSIRIKGDSVIPDYETIHINGCRLRDELLKLKNGEKQRCYFDYGMTDIDIYKDYSKKYYIINWSPVECHHAYFWFSIKDFEDNFINILPM